MYNSNTRAIQVVQHQQMLSKGQKKFNQLIRKIEKNKKRLEEWKNAIPVFMQAYSQQLIPCIDHFNQLQIKLVLELDEIYSQKGLTKRERSKIADIICDIAEDFINDPNNGNQLKELYNKYSEMNFDAAQKAEQEMQKIIYEQIFGVKIEEDEGKSFQENIENSVRRKIEQEEIEKQKKIEREQQKNANRKKSEKTLAKEAKEKEETKNINQSIREIYRKLASALHPDKETDKTEQERKKTLMQRVNVAYDKNDLLQLLELQVEVEQINEVDITGFPEEKLRYYNKLLTEQSDQIQSELIEIECQFRNQILSSIDIFARNISPDNLMAYLKLQVNQVQSDVQDLEKDLSSFKDMKKLKDWLNYYYE